MPAEFEFKLQDLVNIALGSTQLTHVNIAVLQSLIQILLKKLNCQDEVVYLNNYESKYLQNILKSSKTSPLVFKDDNIELISEKLESLEKLQEFVKNLDVKLNTHLTELQRKSNFSETLFEWKNWSSYGSENLCTICDSDNEMACKLLNNTDFLKKLLRRISSPMVDRMFYFEEKVAKLNEEFTRFIQKAEEEIFQRHIVKKCLGEIENLRQKMQEHHIQFMNAMEDIQDILDSKLDKIHMPALKKYIHDNFKRIDLSINNLQDKKKCQRAAGVIIEGARCVSCGNSAVCGEVGLNSVSLLPDVEAKSQNTEKYCKNTNLFECDGAGKTSVMRSLNLGDVIKLRENHTLRSLHMDGKGNENFDLIEGTNGHLYRKG